MGGMGGGMGGWGMGGGGGVDPEVAAAKKEREELKAAMEKQAMDLEKREADLKAAQAKMPPILSPRERFERWGANKGIPADFLDRWGSFETSEKDNQVLKFKQLVGLAPPPAANAHGAAGHVLAVPPGPPPAAPAALPPAVVTAEVRAPAVKKPIVKAVPAKAPPVMDPRLRAALIAAGHEPPAEEEGEGCPNGCLGKCVCVPIEEEEDEALEEEEEEEVPDVGVFAAAGIPPKGRAAAMPAVLKVVPPARKSRVVAAPGVGGYFPPKARAGAKAVSPGKAPPSQPFDGILAAFGAGSSDPALHENLKKLLQAAAATTKAGAGAGAAGGAVKMVPPTKKARVAAPLIPGAGGRRPPTPTTRAAPKAVAATSTTVTIAQLRTLRQLLPELVSGTKDKALLVIELEDAIAENGDTVPELAKQWGIQGPRTRKALAHKLLEMVAP